MLKTYLSEDIFQHAIILYLHNHSYTSTHSDDLWDSFNEVSDLDIYLALEVRREGFLYFFVRYVNKLWYQGQFLRERGMELSVQMFMDKSTELKVMKRKY